MSALTKLFVFHVHVSVRSMRVLAPLVANFLWAAMILAYPGTAEATGAAIFLGYLVFGCWMAVVMGNIDDDAHRWVMTAAAGSRSRLHALRASISLVYGMALALLTSVAVIVIVWPDERKLPILLALFALGVAGSSLGTAIGTLLHRPVIFNIGATVALASLCLVGVMAFPPSQDVLYRFGKGEIALAYPLLGIVAAITVTAVGASSTIAQHRTR